MRGIIVAGGTGGHIYPGIAIGKKITKISNPNTETIINENGKKTVSVTTTNIYHYDIGYMTIDGTQWEENGIVNTAVIYDEYKDFTFYPEESLSFEGDTGPYLQYSLVRAKKILKKSLKILDLLFIVVSPLYQ